jgi:murein L,D-transpeptidase YcbB/YkuD
MRRVCWLLSVVAFSQASDVGFRPAAGLAGEVQISHRDTADAVGRAIASLLAHGHDARIGCSDFQTERLALGRVYRPPAEALWWTAKGIKPTARTAISLLRAADTQGLVPQDYDVQYLEHAADGLAAADAPAPPDVARFDVALSVSMIRFLTEVHRGRADPRRAGFDYHAGEVHDIGELLRQAVATDQLSAAVREVEPTIVQYGRLKAALVRYRQLAGDRALLPVGPAKVVHEGDEHPAVRRLGRLLHALGDLPAPAPSCESDLYAGPLVEAVRRFQARHGLSVDGTLGPATFRALNVPPSRRVRQIELALERLRWLPHAPAGRFLVANVPAFRLVALADATSDRPALQMGIVVGRAARTRTPLFAAAIHHVIFRPFWYPPRSIITNEILPAVRRNPGYLASQALDLVARRDDGATPLPVTAANLARLANGSLGLRQRSGPLNALGRLKFVMPNRYDVYLHDTPAKALFTRARRDFSHGCIRVENPAALAEFLLGPQGGWTRGRIEEAMNDDRTRRVDLPAPVPVFIYYTTAIVRHDGTLEFFEDIYGKDESLERALRAARPRPPVAR